MNEMKRELNMDEMNQISGGTGDERSLLKEAMEKAKCCPICKKKLDTSLHKPTASIYNHSWTIYCILYGRNYILFADGKITY